MAEAREKIVSEMKLEQFAHKTNGLRMTEMQLKVAGFLEQTDKYTVLGLIDDMTDDLARNGKQALGKSPNGLSKRAGLLQLGILRRWFVMNYCYDAVETCDKLRESQRKAQLLELENTALKTLVNNGWTNRVTFENVVEQIAAYEDSATRDEARGLIEPLLKKDMVLKLREAIKKKVKEQHGEKAETVINTRNVNVDGPLYGIHNNENVNLGGGHEGKRR
jgi:hypothetical protein